MQEDKVKLDIQSIEALASYLDVYKTQGLSTIS